MIRWFKAFLIFARMARWSPRPEWEPTDAQALNHFLTSPTGIKLKMLMDHSAADANLRATQFASPVHCGWACGFRGLQAFILSLTAAVGDPGTTEAQTQDADSLEHLRP